MKVDFAFICDYAQSENKIHALGIGFDTIFAPRLPCQHPSFHLVVQLRSTAAEAGRKDVSIRLIDADGKDVITPLSANMEVPDPPSGALEAIGKLVVGFHRVKFEEYGQYALHVVVQGNEMVQIPIRVAQPTTTG